MARREPVGMLSLVVLTVVGVVAIAAPIVAPFGPDLQFPDRRYAPPLATPFVLGGDQFGRDILSRIIYGARVSLFVGVGATVLGCTVGAALGLASGYFQGKVDLIVQRVIDTMQAFPGLILAMVLVVALGPSLFSVMFAVAVPTVPLATRVVRSATLQTAQLDFVSAARAVGSSNGRIIFRHVFPQTVAPLIIVASSRLGQAIVTEATLGFIGLGVPPAHGDVGPDALLGDDRVLPRPVDRHFPRSGAQHHRLFGQPVRRFPAGCPRPAYSRPVMTASY